jgi:hypothetical protein
MQDDDGVLIIQLHQTLSKRFDEEELRTLCFYMGIDYDDLRGEGKAAKARELLAYLDRHDEIPKLVEAVKELHPAASWEVTRVRVHRPHLQLSGRWVGKTLGPPRPLHIWQITQNELYLTIDTWWNTTPERTVRFQGRVIPSGNAFVLWAGGRRFKFTLTDADSFVAHGWDRGLEGEPDAPFDVIFSRQ